MGFRLSELPVAMRDFGVVVVEVAGCYGRGREFPAPPIGGIDHWTQGGATGEAPSLTAVTFGRKTPTPLAGPLAQVLRARRVGGNPPRAFFVADGVANHAGEGRLVTTSGRIADRNDELFGLEVEYRAYAEAITDEDLDVDARIHAAAAQVCGYTHADVAGHWEYARPAGRKVDRKTIAGGRLRDLVRQHLDTTPAPPDTEDDDVTLLAWLREQPGSAKTHCYVIRGNVASWCPDNAAIDAQVYLGTKWFGGTQAKSHLDPAVWSSLAIMNGPLANLRVGKAS